VSRKSPDKPAAPAPPPEDPGALDNATIAEELAKLEAEDEAPAEPAAAPSPALQKDLNEWKDRAMRTAAEFENFRKRAYRERDEALGRGQAEIVAKVVDVIDDLARVAHLDPAATTAQALHDGMLAIERKFMKVLESAGIEKVEPTGGPFDPKAHEAVTTMPAPDEEHDHMVAQTFQAGYMHKGVLLRPARVAVYQWSGAQQ